MTKMADITRQHTKEKLSVYREYLKNYLSVMCNVPHWKTIYILEPFAGEGINKNNEKGSAAQAADIIKGFRDKSKKNIKLILNESNLDRYESLKNATNQYDFVYRHNYDAKDFLEEVISILRKSKDSHHLFFIDPFGYTQYSQENLNDLLNLDNSDYLIFMPTSDIYRFRNAKDNPARKFVLDLGINEDILNDIKDINSFADQLTIILKDKADTKYGYNYKIENKDYNNSVFHLFFITKKLRGAEKFLEGIDKIKEILKTSQVELFNFSRWDVKSILEKSLSQEKTNYALFDEMIQKGYLAKKVNPVLKDLEKSGKLVVRADFKRRQGAFYLDKKDKTIHIRYQK